MDFNVSTGPENPDSVQQHADLAVRKGTADNGDGVSLFRSGAFDKPAGYYSTSKMVEGEGVSK